MGSWESMPGFTAFQNFPSRRFVADVFICRFHQNCFNRNGLVRERARYAQENCDDRIVCTEFAVRAVDTKPKTFSRIFVGIIFRNARTAPCKSNRLPFFGSNHHSKYICEDHGVQSHECHLFRCLFWTVTLKRIDGSRSHSQNPQCRPNRWRGRIKENSDLCICIDSRRHVTFVRFTRFISRAFRLRVRKPAMPWVMNAFRRKNSVSTIYKTPAISIHFGSACLHSAPHQAHYAKRYFYSNSV